MAHDPVGDAVDMGLGGGYQDYIQETWNIELMPCFEGSQYPYSNSGRLWLDKLQRISVRAGWDEETKLDVALLRLCGEAEAWADSLFGDEWQGRIFDTFSSGPRGDIAETFTSDGPGSSISAHGA